jgi:hypothetical protein
MRLPSNSPYMIFMRLSMVRAGSLAATAALALAACAGQNAAVPATSNAIEQPLGVADAVTTCATSPPQYAWIFKGACDAKIMVKATGGSFTLGAYDSISVKGSIGENNAKGTAIVALADATNTNGDIEKDKGTAFPAYHGEGKTFLYAAAINQSSQTLKPIAKKGKPILQYIITDTKKLPGKQCGAAILTAGSNGKPVWSSIPATITIKGDVLTITQYAVPNGFEFAPKTPLYFAVNCFS